MKLAIFGRLTERTDLEVMVRFFEFLREKEVPYLVHHVYAEELAPVLKTWKRDIHPYILAKNREELKGCDFAYSFGGDGTFLNTVMFAGFDLPVLGVNFGRLGFLTSVTQENLHMATEELMKDMYRIDLRYGVVVESNPMGLFGEYNFGLNDLTLHKAQSNEMITVHTYINGEFLNSYWGDGLIIATPTGSTAYNLACGGPIIHPAANSVAITPVAPHSLTVRPMILPDEYVISFVIESRTGKAMVALDTRTILIETNVELAVRKSDKPVKLVRVQSGNYLESLRDRLMWGRDSRNWKERMGKPK
ncbi:MAG TPA: NAD(+) kinase [Bacteroidetes bacterium]|nr:NAD(+) kinase [Bacteroidota bacterium]